MFYLLFTSQLQFSESTSPLFLTASLIQRPISLSTRKFLCKFKSLVNSYETMTENIRGTLTYELICGIPACTVLMKQPPDLWLEPNPFRSDSHSLLAPPRCKYCSGAPGSYKLVKWLFYHGMNYSGMPLQRYC